jgi:hypothetical protein
MPTPMDQHMSFDLATPGLQEPTVHLPTRAQMDAKVAADRELTPAARKAQEDALRARIDAKIELARYEGVRRLVPAARLGLGEFGGANTIDAVENDGPGEHAAPPAPARRQRQTTMVSVVKAAKRGGADRVEIDPRSGRIIIPLTGAAAEEPSANGGNDELENWIAKHADKIKGPK